MREVTDPIRGFLQFIALQFIEHPDQAQLRVAEIDPQHLSFRLILDHSDVAMLIGRGGDTVRQISKDTGVRIEISKDQLGCEWGP